MSRPRGPLERNAESFPRVSGDEPGLGVLSVVHSTFSPRERG